MIEYGLGKCWNGMGDLLVFLPPLNKAPNDFKLIVSSNLKRFVPLFEGFNVEVNDDLLPDDSNLNVVHVMGRDHLAKQTLDYFNLDSSDFIPKFNIDLLKKKANISFLKYVDRNVFPIETVLVTNCKSTSQKDRGFSKDFFENILSKNENVFFHHFRMDDHYSFSESNYKNIAEYTNVDLVDYAVACNKIGSYAGVNTGDYHLAIASGIPPERTTVFMPKTCTALQVIIRSWIYPKTNLIIK